MKTPEEYAALYHLRLDLMHRVHKIRDEDLRRVLSILDKLSPSDLARVIAFAEGMTEWDS